MTAAPASTFASETSSQPVILARDVRKRYGALQAVDGVSFEVGGGEIFGLLGPNGAGKTTTVEMLEGLRPSDGGELRVLGLDPQREGGALKQRIGVQLQTAALYPHLTVAEVIELFGSFYPHRVSTEAVLEALDLGEKRNAQTRTLSGGQQQRLSVALALVNEPELVFFDEPTTGLDPQARRSLWDLVKDLRARGRSVLLTTHYMEEAEELCDRLAIMDHGRILDMGTVDELVSRRFHERAVRFEAVPGLGENRMAAMHGVRRVAHEDGVVLLYTEDVPATIGAVLDATEELGRPPNDLSVRRATLEDVFLELTGRGLRD